MSNAPKLRFKEFSDEWKHEKLGNLVEYKKGYAFKSNLYKDSGVRVIKISDTSETSIKNSDATYVSENDARNYEDWSLKTNDIIVSTVGSRPPLYSSMVGKVISVPKCCNNTLLNQNLVRLRANELSVQGYLYNYLRKDKYLYHIESICRGNANQVSITLEDLFEYKISYPSLAEQEKIASLLYLFDEKIELQEKKVKSLGKYKKGMTQKIFSQEIRFKDENGENYPEWEDSKLGKICTIKTGKLNANAMVEDGEYEFFTCSKDSFKTDSYAFEGEALLIAGNGDVGNVKYFNGKFNAYQRTYVLQNFECNTIYMSYFLDKYLPKQVYSNTNVGAMPYITLDVLTTMKINVPSLAEQEKIADFLSTIDSKIELEQKKLDKLKDYKRGLLQQMLL